MTPPSTAQSRVLPGHPVKAGAGYDCACGGCLDLRAGDCPCACHEAFTLYNCHRCACPDQAHRMKGWPSDGT